MNERQTRILEAIIQDYIQTGDPVGSRTLSRKYDLGVSSATIRNEMADLEELGLIVQPYTSAGRIPSDKGYRLYVDNLMNRPNIAPDLQEIIVNMLQVKMNTIDTLLEETARLVAMMTNYATVATTSPIQEIEIKHIQLVPVDYKSVACVIVTNTTIVKHHIISTPMQVDYELCLVLSNFLNDYLGGTTLNNLNNKDWQEMAKKLPEHKQLILDIANAIVSTLQDETTNTFTKGATNILAFQEFNDISKAKELLELLEEKPYLINLLSKKNGTTICIGEENNLEPMKQCSLITTTYKLGEYTLGTIGIIGPKRMDYGQVISLLEHIAYQITNMVDN
ncbi:heat-inducible transcription repressor HrcA [Candidatus Epulonipiscium fishelsonii]|uniref:Heat-inducible transcription repressor HrcA n=1 Tax=Candidatus Epulonipiscium fishelsonii TaxID=77094 RepID=A0ACC8XGI0_9FIRM|nr:heat-inducible transcription repressor HrcA [Epulopiscium sp. SCG-B05WGA-EpuloA1]ONI42785.1 heat-inducible transcription repressor HrcA [Epulopiscium sp. SCG-B11WGA-EpuloA1]